MFQMENGSVPAVTASATPRSEVRRLNDPIWILFKETNSGASVATAGSISTASTASIRNERPRNCIRENA